MLQRVGMQFHAVIGECNHARFRDFESNRTQRTETITFDVRAFPTRDKTRSSFLFRNISQSRCNLTEIYNFLQLKLITLRSKTLQLGTWK